MSFGGAYITPEEFKGMQQGFDLAGIDDDALTALIATASRTAEEWTGTTWAKQQYANERHPFRQSRRIYVRNWPVVSVDQLRVYVGALAYATLNVADVFINNTSKYLEVVSLAFATSLTGELITLGITDPVFDITYTAGYDTIPNNVKTAVGIITGAEIAIRRMKEEGIAGALSFTIGSYMVTIGRGQGVDVEGAGFAGYMPSQAKLLLQDYRKIGLA